jgi:RHS repeat-associated protein
MRRVGDDHYGNCTVVNDSEDYVEIPGTQWANGELAGKPITLWVTGGNPRTFTIAGNEQLPVGNPTHTRIHLPSESDLTNINQTAPRMIYIPRASATLYTYHTDVQGNVVAISDAGGRVIETMKYDVYGRLTEVKEWNGSALAAINDANANGFIDASEYFDCSLTKNPYLFQGQRLDEETGLYYFKNRYYDPNHGRFISRDPEGMVDGPNLYAFVNNNPINFTDPLGLAVTMTEAEYQKLRCEGSNGADRQLCAAFAAVFGGQFWFEDKKLVGTGWDSKWDEEFNQLLDDTSGVNMSLSTFRIKAANEFREKAMPREKWFLGWLLGGDSVTTARFGLPTLYVLNGSVNDPLGDEVLLSQTINSTLDIITKTVSKSDAMNILALLQPSDICIISGHGDPGVTTDGVFSGANRNIEMSSGYLWSDELKLALSCGRPGIIYLHGCASMSNETLYTPAKEGGAKVVMGYDQGIGEGNAATARNDFFLALLRDGKTFEEAKQVVQSYLDTLPPPPGEYVKPNFMIKYSDPKYGGMTYEQYRQSVTNP